MKGATMLATLENLALVHVTTGTSEKFVYFRRQGFATPDAYSRARFRELKIALTILGVPDAQQIRIGVKDGEVIDNVSSLAARLEEILADASAVITHPYEGGHPDHDACALAVHLACANLRARGKPSPETIEFAGYHSVAGEFRYGVFLDAPLSNPVAAALSSAQRVRKFAAIKAFGTQPWVLRTFKTLDETYRATPDYDFRQPPNGDEFLYDENDWPITGALWMEKARALLGEEPVSHSEMQNV